MIANPLGVLALSRREIHRFLNVAGQTIFPPILTSTLFIFVFGVAIGHRVDFSSTGLSYVAFIVPGLMALHLMSSAYENTSSSLFIARWHNHVQEMLLAPLSYFEMVLGLLAGGVTRGVMVCTGIYLISLCFYFGPIEHPLVFLYFLFMIAIIFSCAGMLGALWAEDFGMLHLWNVYVIFPLALLGGVFHPVSMLPRLFQILTKFNPLFYLIEGMRYSITGITHTSIASCAFVALSMAVIFFTATVILFKLGYKLRS